MECRGLWGPEDASRWHAAILVPSEEGTRPAATRGEAPTRKLRCIAQCDALVKLVETAMLDEENARLRAVFEPSQLGIATPDGPVMTVMLLWGWFEAMEQRARCTGEATPRGEDDEEGPRGPECILALDLKNAYGEFERAPALRAAEQRCKRAAMLAAVQWQSGEKARLCPRRGSRLVQTIFGLEL